jgi:hypothetical protein
MKSLRTAFVLLAVFGLATPALVGCDDEQTIKKDVEVKQKPDGTVVKEKDEVKRKDDGTVVKEKEKTVDRPEP